MKKLLIISSAIALMSFSANAKDGAYVGFDLNSSHTAYQVTYPGDATDASRNANLSYGFGLNAGYKFQFSQVYLAPELFFDYLNNHGRDTDKTNFEGQKNDSVNINSRYGAKLNLGYDINKDFSVFVNAGLANVGYLVTANSNGSNFSQGQHELGGIYGIGFAYNLTDNLTAKFSVDRQEVKIRGVLEQIHYDVTIKTARLGLAYNF